jgi:hypothetical protein
MYNDKYIWIANQRSTYTFYKYFDWFMFPLLILSGMLSCLSLCSYDIFAFVFRSRRRRDCTGVGFTTICAISAYLHKKVYCEVYNSMC